MRLKISNVQSSFVFIIPRQVICDSSIANIELTVKSVLDDLNNSTLFKISYGLKFSTAPSLPFKCPPRDSQPKRTYRRTSSAPAQVIGIT